MSQLASIRIFAKVAERLNFAEAAKHMGVSASVITRSVAKLEQRLGVRLINRTTRRVSLTDTGQLYYKRCVELIGLLDVMDECVASASNEPAKLLKIAASSAYANSDLPDVLAAYRQREPHTSFELTVFEDMTDITVADFDVCFSAERRLRDSSLICRSLAQARDVIVASPDYLCRRGTPHTPADLAAHDILLASDAPSRYWEFRSTSGTHRVVVRPALNTQSPALIKRAVLAGLGIARLSISLIKEELHSGMLEILLHDAELCGDERTFWILYSGQLYMATAVRGFIDFVVDHYRKNN
ncbi:LysR family transcriptional regulator [Paraburkholderia sp. BR10936]|uniref:LysR family transcriptional regulator n=1 Tax=Paraburkholderia sp. BR10936 TaxID=3236993 RepID=UPI0034D1A011